MNEERKARPAWWAGEQFWVCTEGVYRPGEFRSSRCTRKATRDPDADGNPTKCGIHCDEATAKRRAKSEARYQAKRQEWADKAAAQKQAAEMRADAESILRKIAAGHNDPRTLAAEWVKRKDGKQ